MFSHLLDHLSTSESMRSSFAAADIIYLSSELLISFLKHSAHPDLREKLLDNGVLYFHLLWKLCEKGDNVHLEKVLQYSFRKHLGNQIYYSG